MGKRRELMKIKDAAERILVATERLEDTKNAMGDWHPHNIRERAKAILAELGTLDSLG